MATNRGWMWRRFHVDGTLREDFVHNVDAFIEFAKANASTTRMQNTIKCPCCVCKNRYFKDVTEVSEHIIRRGFTPHYTLWTHHGELRDSGATLIGGVGACSDSNAENNSADMNNVDAYIDDSNPCVQMVVDAVGPELNDTHTQQVGGNEGEQMCSTFDAARFEALLKDANTPLYNGVKDGISVLSVVSELMHQKSEGQTSLRVFDENIRLMKKVLPDDNKLPNTYYECKKKLAKLGLRYTKIDSCINNCMLFYRDNMHLTHCLHCKSSRYKVPPTKGKKGIPHRILRYLPIIPRLQRLFMSGKTAPHMTWHAREARQDGKMSHPCDSEAWKKFNELHPDFASDARNVRIGLCTDGFTPFDHYGSPYSCWPVILTVYNLPPWMCMKEPYMFLNMVIPGPGHPGKDIDVFLRPLIDELITLWGPGVRAFDAASRQHFNMRAALLWTISDLPAYAMLSGWSTHGRLACPYCMKKTTAFWLSHGGKHSHFDCHRKFLPISHPFRDDESNFRSGVRVTEGPPPLLSGQQMLAEVSLLPEVPFGKDHKDDKIEGVGERHNWKKRSVFWELPYWSTLLIRHNLDVMHVEKNVFENLFYTIMDVKGKTKDNAKAREDLAIICNRPDFELRVGSSGKKTQPKAPYALTAAQREKLYTWLKGLKLPEGYGSNISRCVSAAADKCTGLKSHDCHVLLQVLLPIALRDVLPEHTWELITEVSCFFKDICSRVVSLRRVRELRRRIILTMCKLEMLFPPAFFDISEHLMVHLPYECEVGGPVQYRWMYPFERFLHGLKLKVKNKAHVEASICEAYVVQETTTFCSLYFGSGVMARANPAQRANDGGPVDDESKLSTFKHRISVFSRVPAVPVLLPKKLGHIAHTYVLCNTPELSPYLRKFEASCITNHPHITSSELDSKRVSFFSRWMKAYVRNQPRHEVNDRVLELALGPRSFVKRYSGCYTNGFTFHTAIRSTERTRMNTGVSVKGQFKDGAQTYYYGMIQEIWELQYPVNHFGSSDFQERSKRNKRNRDHQQCYQTLGTCSIARVKNKMRKDGADSVRYRAYKKARLRANGEPINMQAKEIMENIETLARDKGVDLDTAMDMVIPKRKRRDFTDVLESVGFASADGVMDVVAQRSQARAVNAEKMALDAQREAVEAKKKVEMLQMQLADSRQTGKGKRGRRNGRQQNQSTRKKSKCNSSKRELIFDSPSSGEEPSNSDGYDDGVSSEDSDDDEYCSEAARKRQLDQLKSLKF